MSIPAPKKQVFEEIAQCPYCKRETTVELPPDYAPVYSHCTACGKKFIAERLAEGFQVLKIEKAPCASDPECRETEMSSCQEE